MPDVVGDLAVNTRVHTTHYLAHEAAGAPGTRHSPRPLFGEGGEFMHHSGALRRENAEVRLNAQHSQCRPGERRDP